jgi:hypothetical protein
MERSIPKKVNIVGPECPVKTALMLRLSQELGLIVTESDPCSGPNTLDLFINCPNDVFTRDKREAIEQIV